MPHSLAPDAEVVVIDRESGRGTLSVRTDAAVVVVGLQRAEQIWVDLLTRR